MPDFTIDESARQGKLDARFKKVKEAECLIERRGPAGPRKWTQSPNAPCQRDCPCSKCNPDAWWMIVCEDCGNKRCPHAEDHEFICTNSNEVGQVGKRIDQPILSWIEFRDLAVAGDGRYVVRRVKTGWIATAYQDGIERLSPVMTEVLCREWCEAIEGDRKLSETAEHEPIKYEVVEE